MNKSSINKLKLFFMGLESRFEENSSIFKEISTNFKTGLKEFKGLGIYKDNKIQYNFNGITKLQSLKEILQNICVDAESYEALEFIYSERGTNILISADHKNVTMKNIEIKESSNEPNTKSKASKKESC